MIAIVVDDEKPMLKALLNAVKASRDISEVTDFSSCKEALEWVSSNSVDIAFLDISMRGMGGIVLAEKIQEIQPDCKIVFCTGYSEYALDAFKLHASGYLLKPVNAEMVQKEIDYLKGQKEKERLLTIKCFGHFEAYYNRVPLVFRRPKSKELLAYLIDRNGSGVTTKGICAVLWEDNTDDVKNRNYLYQLLNDLKLTLREVGVEHILVKKGNMYSVDIDRIDCDYYGYLKNGNPPFMGEYMSQYSWAEVTTAMLLRNTNE